MFLLIYDFKQKKRIKELMREFKMQKYFPKIIAFRKNWTPTLVIFSLKNCVMIFIYYLKE
jgi:hypothetical protein